MSRTLTSRFTVAYADVDRREVMLMPRIFKVLQDAAISHANQFGTGTEAAASRGETWMLNRIAATVRRYPRYGENLGIESWSTGVRGFKGYRDFRVRDDSDNVVVSASSLWLYVSTVSKSIVRVPREIAAGFPVGDEAPCFPALEDQVFSPLGDNVLSVPVTLRYSDFDVNEHVNNASYFDFVQTALFQTGGIVHPSEIRMKYAKEVPARVAAVDVRIETSNESTLFSVERDGAVYALGEVRK